MPVLHAPGEPEYRDGRKMVWPLCGAVGPVAGEGEEPDCPECSAKKVERIMLRDGDDATCRYCRRPYLDCICGELDLW